MKVDKNGSDKNVGSIEKDIKILEEMLKIRKEQKEIIECAGGYCGNCNQDIKALESAIQTIKAYKELEEKWDKDTHTLQNALDLANVDKINNYIPVSLVEEKIEEIKNETWYIDCGVEAKQSCIAVLQELLEKRKQRYDN